LSLISSSENGCFYASVILLKSGQELFKTKCLPNEKIDFNGLGSSHIHQKDKIFLSIGTPEQASAKIRELAQDRSSMFGKILEINKNNLDKIIKGEDTDLDLKIFTLGHRNPQGFTKINDSFFSVEHGPKGGDELNKIIKDKNYGWPRVSYGTQYTYDEEGKAYEINHENNQFIESNPKSPSSSMSPNKRVNRENVLFQMALKSATRAAGSVSAVPGSERRKGSERQNRPESDHPRRNRDRKTKNFYEGDFDERRSQRSRRSSDSRGSPIPEGERPEDYPILDDFVFQSLSFVQIQGPQKLNQQLLLLILKPFEIKHFLYLLAC
jgi:hypothetical protein